MGLADNRVAKTGVAQLRLAKSRMAKCGSARCGWRNKVGEMKQIPLYFAALHFATIINAQQITR